jgi:hypothetical protein
MAPGAVFNQFLEKQLGEILDSQAATWRCRPAAKLTPHFNDGRRSRVPASRWSPIDLDFNRRFPWVP